MTTTIEIERLRLYAYHGVLKQEQTVGNRFEVSIRLDYPFERAFYSDALEDTLNYASVCDIVKAEMAKPSKLLEHVAGRIIEHIMEAYPQITSGWIKISKLNPPIPMQMQSCSVEVKW